MTETQAAPRFRAFIVAVAMTALAALSFHGFLDQFAHDEVSDATANSILIYGLSKAINASVSVLQSAEFSVVVAKISLGEILDPVNDAIERLSAALVWAIGSLFLQRLFLEFTSSIAFKWTFVVTIATVVLAYLPLGLRKSSPLLLQVFGIPINTIYGFQTFAMKLFILITVARFIVPVFLSVSFLVSQVLLPDLDKYKERLRILVDEISINPESELLSLEQLTHEKTDIKAKITVMQQEQLSLQEEHDFVKDRVDYLEKKAGVRRYIPDMIGGKKPEGNIETLRSRLDNLEDRIEEMKDRIAVAEEEMDCIDRQIAGEPCVSWLDKIKDAGNTGIGTILAAVKAASETIVVIAELLMAVIAKNILFPLIFMGVAVKYGAVLAQRALRLVDGVKQDVAQLESQAQHIGRDGGPS